MKFDRRFPCVSETRRTLRVFVGDDRVNKPQRVRAFGAATRAGVWWFGWIPRLRFAPRGMTVTALRVGVGGGRVKSPNGASHESPGHRPGNRGDRREQALKGRSNVSESISRSRSLGMKGPPLQGLNVFAWDEFPRALPWAGIGPRLRRSNAGRCLVVWVDSATTLRSARNDCDCASGRVFQRAVTSATGLVSPQV
jgi:hypothetical protein